MNMKDQEYLDAWAEMSPEKRAELAAAGIAGPEPDYTNTMNPYYSGQALDREAVDFDYPADDAEGDEDKVCDAVRRIVGELLGQSNPALAIECFSLVTGVGYLGDSMTEIGRRHGVTRAAVSKRCIEFADALDLDSSRAMRKRKSPKRNLARRPEVVHPHINRVVSIFGRLRRSGWLSQQDGEQLRCLCADLEPIRAICDELNDLVESKKESL